MSNPAKTYEKIERRTGSGAMEFGAAWGIGNALFAGLHKLHQVLVDDPERKARLAHDIQGSLEGSELGFRIAVIGACVVTMSTLRDYIFPDTNEFGIPNNINNWYEPQQSS